jgi:hypothetical protein
MVNVKDWPLAPLCTVETKTGRNRIRRSQDYSSSFASGAVNVEAQRLALSAKPMACLKAL